MARRMVNWFLAEPMGRARFGPPRAHVVERLGDPTCAQGGVFLIAIHQHGIRDAFDDAVVAEARQRAAICPWGKRLDLREMALMTIDPWDARDL